MPVVIPSVLPLYEREPWDPGPQALQLRNAPVPDSRRTLQPMSGMSGNPNSPLTFPAPEWTAEAHRYAYCTNLVLPYANAVSALVLTAPVTYRNFLMLRNLSAAQTVAVQFGSNAGADSALQLPPGGFILFDTSVPQDDMYIAGIAGAGTVACVVSTIALPPMPV